MIKFLDEQKIIEKSMGVHDLLGSEFREMLLKWDAETFGKMIIDTFDRAPMKLKLIMDKKNALPYPWDYQGKFVDFWERMSKSDVSEFRESGTQVLETYKAEKK